ncbi:MAG: extracellular solute-binding protein [Lachnospiraceae bacterium]|nr:extracellular solute-binding protein [Lachnospiraceae bacterium]
MKGKILKCLFLSAACVFAGISLQSCGSKDTSVTEIEIVQYKPEAASYFKQVEEEFNATHNNIHLTIQSPNDASTILRTRFIREDYPDIIGIGGDINYSYYMDAGILADISDYQGLQYINQAYLDIDEGLKIIPTEGVFAVPYVANAAGILYNREIFEEYNWQVPETWDELIGLCETMKAEGVLPFEFGFKDTWTCLAPWNSLAVGLAPADTAKQVNAGSTTFSVEYRETAEKYMQLMKYGPTDPCAFNYNDACTAFARGESAMYTIGSYAVPQILSINPDMKIGSFTMPANNVKEENPLNSGIDLQFCVMADCKNKEAAYEVLDFLLADENIQKYIDAQTAIPCKVGEFQLAEVLDGMEEDIVNGNMKDYQDHYYPSEMAVDAQLQTFVIRQDVGAFLEKFDKDWLRYNRDIIYKVQKYEEGLK